MDDVFRELYQEIILDHNKNPRHFGIPDSYTHSAEGYNPLCGDKVHVFLTVRDGKIDSISFKGEGCAISKASASVMTTLLTGMPLAEAHALMKRFVEVVTGPMDGIVDIDEERFGQLLAFVGVREFPARVKCATLAWHAMEAALKQGEGSVTTE